MGVRIVTAWMRSPGVRWRPWRGVIVAIVFGVIPCGAAVRPSSRPRKTRRRRRFPVPGGPWGRAPQTARTYTAEDYSVAPVLHPGIFQLPLHRVEGCRIKETI